MANAMQIAMFLMMSLPFVWTSATSSQKSNTSQPCCQRTIWLRHHRQLLDDHRIPKIPVEHLRPGHVGKTEQGIEPAKAEARIVMLVQQRVLLVAAVHI